MPNAGGMVPPDWPLSQDGRAPKSLSRSVYPFNTPYVSAFRKRINPRRAHNQIAFVDAQDIQEGSGVVYSENVRDEGEKPKPTTVERLWRQRAAHSITAPFRTFSSNHR